MYLWSLSKAVIFGHNNNENDQRSQGKALNPCNALPAVKKSGSCIMLRDDFTAIDAIALDNTQNIISNQKLHA